MLCLSFFTSSLNSPCPALPLRHLLLFALSQQRVVRQSGRTSCTGACLGSRATVMTPPACPGRALGQQRVVLVVPCLAVLAVHLVLERVFEVGPLRRLLLLALGQQRVVNPKCTSNQSSKPYTVLQYPSRKVYLKPVEQTLLLLQYPSRKVVVQFIRIEARKPLFCIINCSFSPDSLFSPSRLAEEAHTFISAFTPISQRLIRKIQGSLALGDIFMSAFFDSSLVSVCIE